MMMNNSNNTIARNPSMTIGMMAMELLNQASANSQSPLMSTRKPRVQKHVPRKKYHVYFDNSALYFTKREADCICEILQGKTYREAAKSQGVSYRSMTTYIYTIQKKLDCHTREEMISMIYSSDFFELNDDMARFIAYKDAA